ncbi:MAG: RluA family pseudouridine synthase [Phycisphaeraceae bacterium]|nr:RluA family pseudouridine synthase [Phycisphaeraceae bacterium]
MSGEGLSVVCATAEYAVVEKPSGLLSVPGKGPHKQDCVVSRARTLFPLATGPMVVHRLDMETSGLLVVGLTPAAQRSLSMQFEQRTPEKAYVALLDGIIPHDTGEVNLPVRADIDRRPIQIVDHVHGRAALTRFRVLAREIDRTRIRFEPVTGRAHQLRVHAATPVEQGGLGAPILGDVLYGRGITPDAPRLMLHACELSFHDPATGRRVAFVSPAPF